LALAFALAVALPVPLAFALALAFTLALALAFTLARFLVVAALATHGVGDLLGVVLHLGLGVFQVLRIAVAALGIAAHDLLLADDLIELLQELLDAILLGLERGVAAFGGQLVDEQLQQLGLQLGGLGGVLDFLQVRRLRLLEHLYQLL